MKVCPNCGNKYDDNMNFCLMDGAKLIIEVVPTEKTCPNCKSINPPEACYCYACGTKLDETKSNVNDNPPIETVVLSQEAEELLSQLFPVDDIYPGRTTLGQLCKAYVNFQALNFSIKCAEWTMRLVMRSSYGIPNHSDNNTVQAVEIFPQPMLPASWISFGFNAAMTYNEARDFLQSKSFKVQELKNLIQNNIFANNAFIGHIVATIPDGSVTIEICFHDTRYNHTNIQTSDMLPNTMSSVKVSIK